MIEISILPPHFYGFALCLAAAPALLVGGLAIGRARAFVILRRAHSQKEQSGAQTRWTS